MFDFSFKRYRHSKSNRRDGQGSIELIAAVVVIFLLVYGMVRIFLYLNMTLVRRQQAYELSRASITSPGYKNFYHHHQFHVFPQEGDVYEE